MIRKSQLTEENRKLKRKLFIWENINISINSSVKEKEIAAEKFLKDHPDYNLYQKNNTAFRSSRQIAQEFSKLHKNVLADVRNLNCSDKFRQLNFQLIRQALGRFSLMNRPMLSESCRKKIYACCTEALTIRSANTLLPLKHYLKN